MKSARIDARPTVGQFSLIGARRSKGIVNEEDAAVMADRSESFPAAQGWSSPVARQAHNQRSRVQIAPPQPFVLYRRGKVARLWRPFVCWATVSIAASLPRSPIRSGPLARATTTK